MKTLTRRLGNIFDEISVDVREERPIELKKAAKILEQISECCEMARGLENGDNIARITTQFEQL